MRPLVLPQTLFWLALCGSSAASAQTIDRALLPVGTAPPVHLAVKLGVSALLSMVDPELLAAWVPPAAVGRPSRGRVLFGLRMTPTPGVHMRNPDEAWATPEAIVGLRAAARAVHAEHPGSVEMIVGDISLRKGGRFPPHHTHRNGRDADLRYWIKGVEPGDFELHFVTKYSFDTPRNWTFIKAIYDGGWATAIYVDVAHQKLLYRYATKTLGLSPDEVAPILSWPYAARRKSSLVQHVNGHHNHFHVRFGAPLSDFFGSWFTLELADAIHRQLDLEREGHFELVVRRGDTLGSIAQANDVPLDKLMAWNRVGPRTLLQPGRTLRIYAEQ